MLFLLLFSLYIIMSKFILFQTFNLSFVLKHAWNLVICHALLVGIAKKWSSFRLLSVLQSSGSLGPCISLENICMTLMWCLLWVFNIIHAGIHGNIWVGKNFGIFNILDLKLINSFCWLVIQTFLFVVLVIIFLLSYAPKGRRMEDLNE